MRKAACLVSLAVLLAAAASALALTPHVSAEEVKPAAPPSCSCPSVAPSPDKQPGLLVRPRYADSKALLDETDEIAALEAIRVALSEVGDGATYVWHRANGRLSGLVQPTASFKDPAGRVCRHIVLVMSTGSHTARTEGIACRLGDGRWQLDG